MASTIKRESCNFCGSDDNVCHWIDNKTGEERVRCTTPGCEFNCTNRTKDKITAPIAPARKNTTHKNAIFLDGSVTELKSRFLLEETCKRLNYQVGKDSNNEWVRILNWYDDKGNRISQKIKRTNDPQTGKKRMYFINHTPETGLYGRWLWSPNEKLFVTVTEGEEDMMAVMQVQGYQYPVVSLPKGSSDARKSISEDLKYLLGFKYVILAFDNDECGKEATRQCLDLFEPGQVRIAEWPLKDANDMLIAGRGDEIKNILFNAKEITPEASVTVRDVLDRVMIQPRFGIDFPWKTWTEVTYGLQMGEIHVIVAASGIGKTEIVKEIMFHLLDKHDFNIGLFSFEQTPENTIRRLVGSKLHSKLHLPGAEWNPEEIKSEALKFNEKIWLYDKAGRVSIPDLFKCIRYWAKAKNTKLFILDNIKALGIANNTEEASTFMNKLKSLMKELNTTMILLSHVSKHSYQYSTYIPNKKSEIDSTAEETSKAMNKAGLEWETGRMPTGNNVEGGNTIVALSDYVFGLARDRTNTDPTVKRTMRVKVLKARLDSSMDGREFKLWYSDEGKLIELDERIGGF